MFFQTNEINNLLVCTYCQNKFVSVVKNLPCGFPICDLCALDIENKHIENNEFKCHKCNEIHAVPVGGFMNNMPLMQLLNIKPVKVFRGEKCELLKNLLNELKSKNNEFKMSISQCETTITDYCENLRYQITLSTESAIQHINKIRDSLMKEINDYETELIKNQHQHQHHAQHHNHNHNHQQHHVKQKWNEVSAEIDAFNDKWFDYLVQIELNEQEVENAYKRAVDLNHEIECLQKNMKNVIFSNRFMKFQENESFIKFNNYLGSFKFSNSFNNAKSKILIKRLTNKTELKEKTNKIIFFLENSDEILDYYDSKK